MQVQIDDDTRTALVWRLKVIAGQARGIRRMLEDGRAWEDILTELHALQAASHAEDMRALEACALACLSDIPESAQTPHAVLVHIISVAASMTTSPCESQVRCATARGCTADRHVRAKLSAG